jgi:hypothetical protein
MLNRREVQYLVARQALSRNPSQCQITTRERSGLEAGAFLWDRRRSPNDAAPLHAVTGAFWFARAAAEPMPVIY